MFQIPVEDFVFVVCALIGGGLLLITVVVDDVLGSVLEPLDIDVGGSSLMPLLLSFVAMFGVGGLFATQVMDVHGGMAAAVGVGAGLIGAGLAFGLFRLLHQSASDDPFGPDDLVGREAHVSVAIPPAGWGSVYVDAEGQTHVFRATSPTSVPAGVTVQITGTAGAALVVAPSERQPDHETR